MKKTSSLALFTILLLLLSIFFLTGCLKEEALPVSAVKPDSHAISEPDLPAADEPEQSETAEPGSPVVLQPEPTASSDSWYFQRNNQHQVPYVAEDIKTRLKANNAFYVLDSPGNQIYLTFDEGYELGYTEQILDTLKANDVKAIFFVTGHYIDSQPELVIRMKQEGHLVGNHTVNHPDLGIADSATIIAEITGLENKFTLLTGLPMDKYLRPPMGLYSDLSLSVMSGLGYRTVFWSVAFNDWDPNQQPGADYSYQHVMDNIHPGAVILLHAVSQSNAEALDRIIKDLKAAGYIFSIFT
ncbi:MAG TPA: polysaccharide deacetylase family protein [Syntrophomonadaceae bacterium]|nr:polysaccharide deacetylase family protein [Syntrophomonadaceae bacterium]HPR93196.1 polysaccharide deacetylase family protein [Syntrophomonadaceae bacterium]